GSGQRPGIRRGGQRCRPLPVASGRITRERGNQSHRAIRALISKRPRIGRDVLRSLYILSPLRTGAGSIPAWLPCPIIIKTNDFPANSGRGGGPVAEGQSRRDRVGI